MANTACGKFVAARDTDAPVAWCLANSLASGFTFEPYLLVMVSTAPLFWMAAIELQDESQLTY